MLQRVETTTRDILVQSAATCQVVSALGGPNKRGAGSYFDAFESQFVLLLSSVLRQESDCFLKWATEEKWYAQKTLPINQGLSLDTFLSPERWGARHRNSCELTSYPSCTLIKQWVCDNRRQWWHRNIWIVRELWETLPGNPCNGKEIRLRLRSHEKRSQGYLEDLLYSSKQDLLLASYFDHNGALFQLGVELEGSTIHRCAISNGSNVH